MFFNFEHHTCICHVYTHVHNMYIHIQFRFFFFFPLHFCHFPQKCQLEYLVELLSIVYYILIHVARDTARHGGLVWGGAMAVSHLSFTCTAPTEQKTHEDPITWINRLFFPFVIYFKVKYLATFLQNSRKLTVISSTSY